jgi:hypothetical protein
MPPSGLAKFRVRGAYTGAWAKSIGEKATPELVRLLAKLLVEEVIKAAREAAQPPRIKGSGTPMAVPNEESFFRSFEARVRGDRTVEIVSHYPMIQALIEGRGPYPMKWLTQSNGVYAVPITKSDGTVIFRTAPANPSVAWMHPGFEKHDFIKVAVTKARKRYEEEAAKIVAKTIERSNLVFK